MVVLLGGYASKRCARRVHNDHDRTIPSSPWEVPPDLQRRFDAGNAFEEQVFGALRRSLRNDFLIVDGVSTRERTAATVRAMSQGVRVIAGGQLPDDTAGGRAGRPDLLVRRTAAGQPPGYVPADVKHHLMTKASPQKTIAVSAFGSPWECGDLVGRSVRISPRLDDYLQLAHYTRMLQAGGFHAAGCTEGAIIGTDELLIGGATSLALVWLDLGAPLFATYSASQGKVKRSALDRYDHEHEFRVKVAATAELRVGAADDPTPWVVPIWQPECETCPWHNYCKAELGSDDASVNISAGRLDVREWLALADAGITTTTSLAQLDPSEPSFQADYLPRVTHQTSALSRLDTAVVRAQMIRDGHTLRRLTSGPLMVPTADVEVDFDIEWDATNRVYLWGAQVRRGPGAAAAYHSFVSWQVLDEAAERALAEQFVAWLEGLVAQTHERNESIAVFHYTSPEKTYLNKILGEDAVAELLDVFVDLQGFMQAHFLGVSGLGIKKVAPAFGFAWHDEDPGGLQSQGWVVDARTASDPAQAEASRQRLLRYNADDVAATAAIRDGLRSSGL